MDPITIVTTVGGLVTNILKIYDTINSKASLYQAAETNAVCTLAICRAVGRALRQIQDTLINQDRLQTDPTVSDDLVSVIGACQITFQLLIDKLMKLVDVGVNEEGQMNKISKVKMMWNDQEMKELLSNIQGQSSALQLLISAIHLSSNAEILALLHQRNNRALLNRVKDDVSSLRGFRGLRLKDSDEGSAYASSESIDFDFDFQVINSGAYRRAFASAQQAGSKSGLGAASSSTRPTAGNVRPEPVISQTTLSEVEVSMQTPQQLRSPPSVFVIIVCLIDGTNISLGTNTHETISNLKFRVAAKRGGLITQSLRPILLYNTIELEDLKTLSHYGISTEQTLNLVDVRSKSITLKTFAGRTFDLTYDGPESVRELKRLIHFIEGTPPQQQCLNFKWLGFGTEPDLELWTGPFTQYDGETIFLLKYDSLGVEYRVKDPVHNTFYVPIHLHDTVLELKKKLAFLQGTKVELQTLFQRGEKLEDNQIIGLQGMASGRLLRLVPRLTQQILIYRDNGPNFPINVNVEMTVAGLKENIERSELIPIEDQFIVHGGIIRPDDYVFWKNGPAPPDPIYLVVRTPLETIISYGARAETLKCESSDTIDDLKQRIQSSVGVPVAMQTLVYQGRVIRPGSQVGTTTLSELGIANGQTVDLFSMVVKAEGEQLSSEVYCNKTETIRILRERICRMMSIRVSYLMNKPNGVRGRRLSVLRDANLLSVYSIRNGDTILLRDVQPGVYDATRSPFD